MADLDAQSLGRYSEDVALAHLQRCGLALIARNFRCRVGELDLVMRDRDCLVVVEVRCRQPQGFASPVESVDLHKRRKLAAAAACFLLSNREFRNAALRFDVVAVEGRPPGRFKLQWLQDAFRPGDWQH